MVFAKSLDKLKKEGARENAVERRLGGDVPLGLAVSDEDEVRDRHPPRLGAGTGVFAEMPDGLSTAKCSFTVPSGFFTRFMNGVLL